MIPQRVDVAIITVISEEYEAVHDLLEEVEHDSLPDSPNLYGWELGWIRRAEGSSYRVVLALAGRQTNLTSAQVTVKTVERYRPRYVMLVGIAGGFPLDGCTTGDVAISSEIYAYQYGKLRSSFEPRPNFIYRCDQALLAAAQRFTVTRKDWNAGLVPPPRCFLGPIASGDMIMDDPSHELFAAVHKVFPKIQAIEMEGAGAASAIEILQAEGQPIGFIMVRGISDVPRTDAAGHAPVATQTVERDTNKRRACKAAAQFAVKWIAQAWPLAPHASSAESRDRTADRTADVIGQFMDVAKFAQRQDPMLLKQASNVYRAFEAIHNEYLSSFKDYLEQLNRETTSLASVIESIRERYIFTEAQRIKLREFIFARLEDGVRNPSEYDEHTSPNAPKERRAELRLMELLRKFFRSVHEYLTDAYAGELIMSQKWNKGLIEALVFLEAAANAPKKGSESPSTFIESVEPPYRNAAWKATEAIALAKGEPKQAAKIIVRSLVNELQQSFGVITRLHFELQREGGSLTQPSL
jgi:nucleoside phosphorylase